MKVFQTSIPNLMKITHISNFTNFSIDPEFASLLPPLLPDEDAKLEASIAAEGTCHTPLVVWREHNILLDGHHRYRICDRLGLPYQVEMMSLPDRDAARTWIIEEQVG